MANDIDCMTFLEECELSQYREIFMKNFSVGGGLLSRRRLSQVRQQDFCKMNITLFDHQKILMKHIRETLSFKSFNSPERRNSSSFFGRKAASPDTSKRPAAEPKQKQQKPAARKRTDAEPSTRARRRSFDESAWEAIHGIRSNKDRTERLAKIRESILDNDTLVSPRNVIVDNSRRWTYDDKAESKAGSAKNYGNQALELDMLWTRMLALEKSVIGTFHKTVGCEKASIIFIDSKREELVLLLKNDAIRFPLTQGIAGYCACTGESLNIPDCYADPRFNNSIDKKTGFHTHNLLCAPIRSKMGGGKIVAILEMINKFDAMSDAIEQKTIDDQEFVNNPTTTNVSNRSYIPFTDHDEVAIAACATMVGDSLDDNFSRMLDLSIMMGGSGMPSSMKIGEISSRYQEHTSQWVARKQGVQMQKALSRIPDDDDDEDDKAQGK